MDLPRSLRRRVPSEVNTMQAFLQRQLARLDYIQACKPRRAQLLKVLHFTQLHSTLLHLRRSPHLASAFVKMSLPDEVCYCIAVCMTV